MVKTLDFDKITRNVFDRISVYFGIEDKENEKIYGKTFKKIFFFVGYKAIPFFLQIVSIVMLFWIFFRIFDRSGFEKTVIILLLVIIMSVRGLKQKPAV